MGAKGRPGALKHARPLGLLRLAFAASHSALSFPGTPCLAGVLALAGVVGLLHASVLAGIDTLALHFPSAALAVLTGTAENITAAAAARATLDRILEFILRSP